MTAGAVGAEAAEAGKKKKRVTEVTVDSRSTLNFVTYSSPASDVRGVTNSTGMKFKGRVIFGKVHLDHPSRAKLTKTIKKKSRQTCVRLFARRSAKGWNSKVQIWTHGGPVPAQPFISPYLSQVTLDFRDTVVSGAGTTTVLWEEQSIRLASWTQNEKTWYGISPGEDIVAKGGWWDPDREYLRDHSGSFKIKQWGKRTEIKVNCNRFNTTGVWKP